MHLFTLAITIVAVALFGAFVLLGAWIDGRRQALRDKGLHPVTDAQGNVSAQEYTDASTPHSALHPGSKEQPHGTGHHTAPPDIRKDHQG